MDSFPGIKQTAGSKAFYYDDRDVNMIDVPIGKCQGDSPLTDAELDSYFGIHPSKIGKLPEYIIAPRLHSAHDASRSFSGLQETRLMSEITGEVENHSPNLFHTEFESVETTIKKSEIYGSFEASFSISAGGSWKSMKAEASAGATFEANYRETKEFKEEIKTKGTYGEVVVKEIVMGMSLRVKRVYEHSVNLRFGWKLVDPIGKAMNFQKAELETILTWDGPESWDDIMVKSSALRDVGPLQFHPVPMTGNGYKHGLWLQVLPVFEDKKFVDMHLIVSADGWKEWAAYGHGTRTVDSGREETLPMPGYITPMVTHIAVTARET
ncbi:hypothetical protein BGZ67_001820 [Mortierella alpina]|nr:hypothetical protein BGZ67_001820 [Mortierella alpina]